MKKANPQKIELPLYIRGSAKNGAAFFHKKPGQQWVSFDCSIPQFLNPFLK